EFVPQVVHNDLFQILGLFGILRTQRVNDDLGLALCQPRNLGFYDGEDEVGDGPGAPLGDVRAPLIALPHFLPPANPATDFSLGPEGLLIKRVHVSEDAECVVRRDFVRWPCFEFYGHPPPPPSRAAAGLHKLMLRTIRRNKPVSFISPLARHIYLRGG